MLAFTGKYWLMMAPLVKHSLVQRYGREFASQTMRRAKSVYRERVHLQTKCKIIVGKRAKKGEDRLALAARLVVV